MLLEAHAGAIVVVAHDRRCAHRPLKSEYKDTLILSYLPYFVPSKLAVAGERWIWPLQALRKQ